MPSLREFGARLVAADERSVARRRRGTTTVAALAGAIVAAASFTGAAAVALTAATGSPVPSFARGDDTGVFPAPGTSRISTVRAADPGSGLPWTVRVGRSRGGLVCIGVGQLDGASFGIRGADGRFRTTSPIGSDDCGPAPRAAAPVVALRGFSGPRADDPAGAATLVFGSGGSGLRSVVVRAGDGRDRTARPAADGTFVVALPGWPEGAASAATLRWADGRERVVRLGLADGNAPDPSGMFSWSNDALFRVHVHGRNSPRGCLSLVPVRVSGRRLGTLICVSRVARRALVRDVRTPVDGGRRTVVALETRKGERVTVRVGRRDFPVLVGMTADDPRRVVRTRDGRREVVRRPEAVTGPRAAIAILPAGVAPGEIDVRVVRDGRSTQITDVRGAGR
ncbi:hypothetical protein [Patulibacter minatonensis]|uniref:hypothetical protein n=1 Tax=Patulibacter minatonensis TaxID=298163 RepID=UPI0012F7A1F4|nr:hypothetical protein [Patulibacter minatonensis]